MSGGPDAPAGAEAQHRPGWVQRQLERPVFWLVAALLSLVLGVAKIGARAFLEPVWSARTGKWEEVVFLLGLVATLAGVGLVQHLNARRPALLRRLEAWQPAWLERLRARFVWIDVWGPPLVVWAAWSLLWVGIYHRIDPEWIANGVDWHDSYLGAYAFKYNDPIFYVPWRYPLYPGLAAALSSLTGLSLPIAIQLLSRLLMTGVAVPLFVLGRTLYGAAAGVLGVVLLLTLTTVFYNGDTVTPYPMFMFVGISATAGLATAARGSLVGMAFGGLFSALLFCCDSKGLAPGLAMTAAALGIAVVAPVRIPQGGRVHPARSRVSSALWRGLRVLMVVVPLVGSYLWMNRLPITPFTLEEISWSVLERPGAGATTSGQARKGYAWGKFEDWWTIPRTITIIRANQQDPSMQGEYARRQANSINRLRIDYPGVTWRMVALCGLGVLLPLLRRDRSWRDRLLTGLQLGPLWCYLYAAWPIFQVEYWDRYLLHAAVLFPLLAVGGASELLRFVTGSKLATQWARIGALALVAAAVLLWPGSALRLGHESGQFDSSQGGRQEVEVLEWARQTMKPGDILFDTTWMMTGLLLAGEYPVARPEASYPPQGVPMPSGQWKVTKPWPEKANGKRYALVGLIAEAPGVKAGYDAAAPPTGAQADPVSSKAPDQPGKGQTSLAGRKPDNPIAAAIHGSSRWKQVFVSEDGVAIVYEDTSSEAPDWWLLPARMRP